MEFRPIPCHESLRPFIRNYWQLTAQCTATGTQQIFSNGAASLHFYLSQPVRLSTASFPALSIRERAEASAGPAVCLEPEHSKGVEQGSADRQYRTVLFHQNMQKVGVICEPGPFYIFGAEFVPFCSRVFFRSFLGAQGEQSAIYASPEEFGDARFEDLCRSVHAAADTDERVSLLDDFFLERLSDFPEGDVNIERLADVFDDIVPTDGSVACPPRCQDEFSPADLASTACLSQKQFTRVFQKYVGMNPKSYLRLLRFHKALQKIRERTAEGATSLTDIALQSGYYDLSHMTADFRDICGYSPSELLISPADLTEAFGQQFSGLMKKKIKIENLI